MAGIARTPEGQAETLEKLAGNPPALRERMESMLNSCLQMIEQDARYGAVVLRRIRDRELYRKAGWPTWTAFAEFWCPGGEERFDTLIVALEVLESRGEQGTFSEEEAKQLARLRDHGGARKGEKAKDDQPSLRRLKYGDNDEYAEARLRRDAGKGDPKAAAALGRAERGDLSWREAAQEAGALRRRSAYSDLCAAWRRASPEERDRFEDWIAGFRRRDAA